jgi:TolB protein
MNLLNPPAKRLTFLQIRSILPCFSPDGAKIVFSAQGRRRCATYLMNADESELQCLTTDEGQYGDPVFSPDGKQIVFCSNGEGVNEIYFMPCVD